MTSKKLALIGAGYWGKNLARNFHALGALHTICDVNQTLLESYGSDYAGVRKTNDVNVVFHDPAIEEVVIAAPAIHHYKLAKAALLAAKDVFVEKPLCLDLIEAQEIIELARSRGRVLMVGHLLQYHPHLRRLHELSISGELGKLCYITSNRLNLGKIRREENVLWSFAPHDLSVIISLAGSVLPYQVQCQGGAYLTPGVADTTLTTLSFTGGLRAHVFVSWLNPFKEQKLTVVGEHAMAVFDDTKVWGEKLSLYRNYLQTECKGVPTPNRISPEYIDVPEGEPLRAECIHFLECCRDRTVPRTDGAEGERVLRLLTAAQNSLTANGTVENVLTTKAISIVLP